MASADFSQFVVTMAWLPAAHCFYRDNGIHPPIPPVRSPRVLTRSFPLIPAIITACDSGQLLGFDLNSSLTLAFGLYDFYSSGQSFAFIFLQIPPHGGHP